MNKLIDYNSPEKEVLLELFDKMPMMDKWIASVIENFIYGYVRIYHRNGLLKTQYKTKYGEKDGEYKEFYDNGQIWLKYNYLNGKKNDEYEIWNYNGQLLVKTNYINDIVGGRFYIRDNCKKNVEYKEWNSEGRLSVSKVYEDGVEVKDKMKNQV